MSLGSLMSNDCNLNNARMETNIPEFVQAMQTGMQMLRTFLLTLYELQQRKHVKKRRDILT